MSLTVKPTSWDLWGKAPDMSTPEKRQTRVTDLVEKTATLNREIGGIRDQVRRLTLELQYKLEQKEGLDE